MKYQIVLFSLGIKVGIVGVFMQNCIPLADASTEADKSFAYKLMVQQFSERFSKDAIQKLEILDVVHDSNSRVKISYNVEIMDKRDTSHLALNSMKATVIYVRHNAKWVLSEVRDMKQHITFHVPK